MNKLEIFNSNNARNNKFAGIMPGWTVKVHQQIKEGNKTRIQSFEGTVLAKKHGNTASGTITIRKVFSGIGVEKVYPIYLPSIEKVEVIKKSNVRRAKLYYLKDKSAREIRKKVKQITE
jgi:large subunit ribosomal protein L19